MLGAALIFSVLSLAATFGGTIGLAAALAAIGFLFSIGEIRSLRGRP